MEYQAATEREMEGFGARLAAALEPGAVIYLRGPLGAGKTTLVRGLLRALGWEDAVRSPTYTLVESYTVGGLHLHHFDLYRLGDPEELEFIGLRDFLDRHAICLVEWPEQGIGMLPDADLVVDITPAEGGRGMRCTPHTSLGHRLMQRLGTTSGKGGH